jgi:hypothetical protein
MSLFQERFNKHIQETLASKLKKGDHVKNINGECEHGGSEGDVEKVIRLPHMDSDKVKNQNNMPGRVVQIRVTNSGKNYEKGDRLTKTGDQLVKKPKSKT